MTDQHTDEHLREAVAAFQQGDITYHGETDAPPPLDGEPMVMRGVRLPASLDQRVKAAAYQAGVPFSALIRDWIELGLTEMENDQPISLAALRRAIAHVAQSDRAA